MAIIDKPTDYFDAKIYTGNGSTGHAITGVGHQQDLTWIKQRSGAEWHILIDSVRGVTKYINSNDTGAERTSSNFIESFDSNGFTLGSANDTNQNSQTYASWNWKAGGSASSNSNGSITSSVSANQDAGFSIVTYTGGGGNATVGHGLGVAPGMMIIKNRSASQNWVVYHQSIGNTKNLYLNRTDVTNTTSGWFNNTSPTSTVFTIGNDGAVSGNGNNLVAYCFAEKQGYSKFGSYTGNGSENGVFCFTGMKVGWLMVKRTDSANSWIIMDNKGNTFNPMGEELKAEENGAGNDATRWDQLSNGFKLRNAGAAVNASGGSYIYMAFASNPLVTSTGVPATAR